MSSISFQIPEPGIWTVTGEFGGQIVTQRINITDKGSSTPIALTFSPSTITVASPVGTSLLLTDGTNQLTAISTGTNVFTIYNMGQWTVSGTLEGYTLNSVTVNVAAGQNYPVELEIQTATLTVTAPVGTLVSVKGGGDTQEITATNGTAVFQITTLGSYQVSGTLNGLTSNTVTVDVTAYQNYTATLTIEAASIVVTTLDDVLVTAQNGNITLTDTAVNGQVTFKLKPLESGRSAAHSAATLLRHKLRMCKPTSSMMCPCNHLLPPSQSQHPMGRRLWQRTLPENRCKDL